MPQSQLSIISTGIFQKSCVRCPHGIYHARTWGGSPDNHRKETAWVFVLELVSGRSIEVVIVISGDDSGG